MCWQSDFWKSGTKPAPSIFKTALERLGQPADATIMVGDSYAADVTGGIRAGLLATVWVRPGQADGSLMYGHVLAVPEGQPAPSHVVESILELEAVLLSLG